MDKKFENKGKQEEHEDANDDEFEEVDDESGDHETNGEIIDHTTDADGTHEGHGRRRRVKIKKRIRVKKKTSSKRKYKKLFERIVWTLFIVGFITVLFILFKQLEIGDDKYKANKRRGMIFMPQNNTLASFCNNEKKQNHHISVIMI